MDKKNRLHLAVFLLLTFFITSCSSTKSFSSAGSEKKIKNVILMIPDGTSLAAVSSARWYQWYNNPDLPSLNIDPYICGTIFTFSSNAPIGDSAPTTSTYMTGYPSRAGYVSTYPPADPDNDIFPVNPEKAYQPLMTAWEAARITKGKAVGLVFTCEFPHATPADCMSHSYNRGKYDWIVPQMVHNGIDVVIGGGAGILKEDQKAFLKNEGYGVFQNDMQNFRNYSGNKMWALFRKNDMAYDIDRNPKEEPSIAEMTQKAIEKLSKNENGFVLMVEGSKIDWAAHANDAVATITDMIAFDKACGVALDFAKENEETLVVIVPDHGNSGISIGSQKCPSYSSLTKDQLFGQVSQFKTSVDGLMNKLHETQPENLKKVVLDLTGITLSDEDYEAMLKCRNFNSEGLSDTERMYGSDLKKVVTSILDKNTCFGFTTGGHTGEEVFLAVYDPTPNRLTGHHTNIQLNHYLRQSIGLEKSLESLTEEYFAKHTDVFADYAFTLNQENEIPVLEVKTSKNTLTITPNTNVIKLDNKEIKLESVIVYVDKNNTFYLPKSLAELLNN